MDNSTPERLIDELAVAAQNLGGAQACGTDADIRNEERALATARAALQSHIAGLEAEIARLQAENATLCADVDHARFCR